MLTDMRLRALKPTGKIYKVADQQGLYVAVTRTGVVSFRFDYRINGRRETLVVGQYDSSLGARKPRGLEELDYGMSLKLIRSRGEDFEPFTVHDLRRTASTLLHEVGFNSDWVEKCLAHEQRGVRAIYNKAEYAEQRRTMLQTWADILDGWIKNGGNVVPIRHQAAAFA